MSSLSYILSRTGYSFAFTPQAVLGAKRIIISSQNHSAGLATGFRYSGETYKGSRLNSLPPGVYVDTNKTGENKKEMVKVATVQQAQTKFKEAFQARETWTSDTDREEIITNVLKTWFTKNS